MRIKGSSGQPQTPQQTNVYITQEGETLGSVAAKLGISESNLALSNNLTQKAELKAGQQLTIPYVLQKTPLQQGIASTDNAFENARSKAQYPGIVVQTKGANQTLNAARLAEDIRFRSQFQAPQVALGKLKSPSGKTE